MKKFIKGIIGDALLDKIRDIRNKISPGDTYKEEIKVIERCRVFYSGFVKEGDLCFDVGANMGNKVVPLLALNARVIAIEPQKSCQDFLKRKFRDRITIVPKGLGEKEEVREFYISNASTISSFSKEWINEVSKSRFKDYNWNTVSEMSMTTLDKLIETYGLPVFIKIDVEGYELEVLKGLSKPVSMISFEYTVPEQTNNAIDCIKRLSSINPNIVCNYSKSDSMEYEMTEWKNAEDMIQTINNSKFIESGFGDIYVKTNNK